MQEYPPVKKNKVSAALLQPSGAFGYRFYLSVGLFLLMLFLLAFHYSEVGFFILVLINALFCADIFVRCAWKDLWHGKTGFALLVSTVVYAGFFYSAGHTFVWHAVSGPVEELYLYVSLFLTLSLWVQEHRVKQRERAGVYMKKIDDFLPKSGRKCVGKHSRMVFVEELKTGDEIIVNAGERFPCDGEIIQGKTAVDEQLITGNQLPAYKQAPHIVYAGTVNKTARVVVRVIKPLQESALMDVITSVQNSEQRRSEFVSELDTYAAWTLLLLVLVGIGQYVFISYTRGAFADGHAGGAFLVILSLCTPLALLFAERFPVLFAFRAASLRGIKIQNRYALEQIAKAEVLFFDKTGTLTCGTLLVKEVCPVATKGKTLLLEAAACATQQSTDPLYKVISLYTKKQGIMPKKNDSLEIFPGLGVRVSCARDVFSAGLVPWMEEQRIKLPAAVYQTQQTVVCVTKNGVCIGFFTLEDSLRRGAKEVVDFLIRNGKEVMLLSGDTESAVSLVAKELGVEKYNANVLPKTKAEIVTNLRALGKKVVMVGDGFNDIIALLRSDAAIVYASSQKIYANWVDILISRKDLYPLIDLLALQAKIRRISTGNVVLALGLSIGWVEFLFCRAPQLSDWRWTLGGSLVILLFVFLNSMRLLKIR